MSPLHIRIDSLLKQPLAAAAMAAVFIGLIGDSSLAQNSDLPYSSPSTGADGPLVIPDTLPTKSGGSRPTQLAFDPINGYLMAMGQESDSQLYMGTYLRDSDFWLQASRERDLTEAAIVWDGTQDKIIRYGGVLDGTSFYRGLYVWTGDAWESLSPDGERPASRSRASLAYDSARNEVVLFGGSNNDGALLDTWTWNGTTWTLHSPANVPPGREWGSMAFDAARGEVVLFGGNYENDTWTWNGSNWNEESPATNPPNRQSSAMAYDPIRQVVVLCLTGINGELETWEWNGANWTEVASTSNPGERNFHGLVFNPETSRIELHNGLFPNNSNRNADSWSWDGSNWELITESPYFFDMSEKPDGIWNFTSIDIGTTEVRFIKNAANTPVVWLATEDVIIDGHLNLNGTKAYQGYTSSTEPYNLPAPGGPGGHDGGLGGYYQTATGADVAGTPGAGPGGGAASPAGAQTGDLDAYHALHFNTYNSSSLQDISGGSGGGGAASATYAATNEFGRGGNGGGGGGAIVIASSKDIWVNGSITAIGGEGRFGTYKTISSSILRTGRSQGGSGSGGAIRLVADRVFSANAGSLDASSEIATGHDRDEQPENKGRIRIEAYFHNISWADNFNFNHISISNPKDTFLGSASPSLTIDSIAGQGVSANPSGDPASPDVTFSSAGPINVVVSANNLPDGTGVNLRVTSGSEVVFADPQTLTGGTATFSLVVPAGSGVAQVWTDPQPAPAP